MATTHWRMIVKQITYIILVFILLSCKDVKTDVEKNDLNPNLTTIISTIDTEKKVEFQSADTLIKLAKVKLIVTDKTKYSKKFLKGLMDTPSDYTFKLKDSVLTIIGQGDVIFPNVIPLNEKRKFVGKRNDEVYDLLVGQINYSTIAFELKIIKNGKQISFENGTADIGSMFFLGSEVDTDSETGVSYSSTEYYGELKDCDFSFRISDDKDNGKLRAKINRKCTDKLNNIDLEHCPTLYEK